MNYDNLIQLLEEKRSRFMITKKGLSTLIGINANFLRDILHHRKTLPKAYHSRVKDFIELPLEDFITKYIKENNNYE